MRKKWLIFCTIILLASVSAAFQYSDDTIPHLTPPPSIPRGDGNSSFNQTLGDLLYWRLDASNDNLVSANWIMSYNLTGQFLKATNGMDSAGSTSAPIYILAGDAGAGMGYKSDKGGHADLYGGGVKGISSYNDHLEAFLSVLPTTSSTLSLGSALLFWQNVYASTYIDTFGTYPVSIRVVDTNSVQTITATKNFSNVNINSANLAVTGGGNVSASYFFGNGSGLSSVCLSNGTGCTVNSSIFNSTYDAKVSFDRTNLAFLNNTQTFTGVDTFNDAILVSQTIADSTTIFGTGITAVTPSAPIDRVAIEKVSPTGQVRALTISAEYNGTGGSSSNFNGLNAFARTQVGSSGTLSALTAGGSLRNRYVIQHAGDGLVSYASSVSGLITLQGTGNMTEGVTFNSEPPTSSSSWFMNYSGLRVRGPGLANIVNFYGVRLDSTGVNGYGIYQEGSTDKNLFNGNVTINNELIANNITTNQLLKIKPITLPACASTYNNTFMVNSSSNKPMYCDGSSWNNLY